MVALCNIYVRYLSRANNGKLEYTLRFTSYIASAQGIADATVVRTVQFSTSYAIHDTLSIYQGLNLALQQTFSSIL